jgi:RNA polymerase sigma-70 factor (ECF subfamily)
MLGNRFLDRLGSPFVRLIQRSQGLLMFTTPPSLLDRLRGTADPRAWDRFVQLYSPLLLRWARQTGLQTSDAADLVQDVFVVLLRKMPQFDYDRQKSFRGWLRTVVVNKYRERLRTVPVLLEGGEALEEVSAPDDLRAFEEEEYRRHLVQRALQLLQPEFPASVWEAFWEYAVQGRGAEEVAAELGLRPGSVYAAKSRVMTRLRQEISGLLD